VNLIKISYEKIDDLLESPGTSEDEITTDDSVLINFSTHTTKLL